MNDKPIKTFRDAEDRAVAASIWLRQTAAGQFYDVTFSRAWKDQESGDSGYSQNFSGRNLDAVVRVASDAQGETPTLTPPARPHERRGDDGARPGPKPKR